MWKRQAKKFEFPLGIVLTLYILLKQSNVSSFLLFYFICNKSIKMCHHPVLCILFLSLHFQVIFASYFNFSSPSTKKFSFCSPEQSFVLLNFKNTFSIGINASSQCQIYSPETDSWGDYSYPKIDSWKEGSDCCSWDGVTCDRFTGNVIGLDLSSSRLIGTIHQNNSLFLLHHL